jgi:hypothetical protein
MARNESVVTGFTVELERTEDGVTTRDQAMAVADSEISRRFSGYRVYVMSLEVAFDDEVVLIGTDGVIDVWDVDVTLRCERELAKAITIYHKQYGFCPDPAADVEDRRFLGQPVRFRVYGTCNGYAFEDTKTGEIRGIGDGVDAIPDGMLEAHEDMVVEMLQESLNFDQAETIEAYGLRE